MNLVKIVNLNGESVVSSRQVAEHFEKEHFHVTRDIEHLIKGISKNGDTPSKYFIMDAYKNEQNKQWYKEYLLTKDGFSLLVMGFSGARALEWKLKYIDAFNKLEENYKNKLFQMQSEAIKEITELKSRIKELESKVNKPIMIENPGIDMPRLFDMINDLAGSEDLVRDVHYKLSTINDIEYLFINFKKVYKYLKINYPNESMLKLSVRKLEDILETQPYCESIHYPVNLLNERSYSIESIGAAMININDLLNSNININNIY